MELLEFKDLKCVPDIIHPYTPALRNNNVPIVIDNGTFDKPLNLTSNFVYIQVLTNAGSVGQQAPNLYYFLRIS
jgi:hypothetical protein